MWPFNGADDAPVPPAFDPELVLPGDPEKLAKRNVWSGYQGPVEEEQEVAAGLRNIEALLIELRRSDTQIAAARDRVRQSEAELNEARERHARTAEGTGPRIARVVGIPSATTDPEERRLLTDAIAAYYEREASCTALAAAEGRHAGELNQLMAASEQMQDRLGAFGAAGIRHVNRYVVALNRLLTREGKNALLLLDVQPTLLRLVEAALAALREA